MQYKPVLKWALGTCLTLLLFACNDHRLVPSGQRFRVTQVVAGNSQFLTTTNYAYNNSNKLENSTQRINSRGAISQATTRFNYNSQGRLSTTEQLSNSGDVTQRVTFSYDAAGNVASARRESFSPPATTPVNTIQETFIYSSGKYPTTVTSVVGDFTTTRTYTYSNDNIVQTSTTFMSPSSPTSQTVESFVYDDKPNPYYGLTGIGYGPEVFSKNNVIVSGRSYTYDTNGLLTLVTQPGGPEVGGPSTISYTYEFY